MIRRIAGALLAAALLPTTSVHAMTGDSVAAQFRGAWVARNAACTSAVRVVIDANVVTFVNGTARAEYRKLEQCFTCMGKDVKDVTILSTDAMGDSPFTIHLDGSEKPPSARSTSATTASSARVSRSGRTR